MNKLIVNILSCYPLMVLIVVSSILIHLCMGKQKMETEEWCNEFKGSLENLDLGWPVAKSGSISLEQSEGLEVALRKLEKLPEDDDLFFVVSVWAEKYRLFRPYLEKGDLEGFNQNIKDEDKKQMHLANVSISNFCEWSEW